MKESFGWSMIGMFSSYYLFQMAFFYIRVLKFCFLCAVFVYKWVRFNAYRLSWILKRKAGIKKTRPKGSRSKTET